LIKCDIISATPFKTALVRQTWPEYLDTQTKLEGGGEADLRAAAQFIASTYLRISVVREGSGKVNELSLRQ
jgi:hypothetical protein